MPKNTLKQQSLGFATRRSAATSNAKLKGSNSPATVPSTPIPAIVPQSPEANHKETEGNDAPTPQTAGPRRTRASAKAQAVVDESAASKKRKLHDVEELSAKTSKGRGKEASGKRVFRSRVSLENVEGRQPSARDEDSSSDDEPDVAANMAASEKEKKARVLRHYDQVREKMGHLKPIHAEGQKKEHHILRVFDLSYEYGPCIGMTRLQRWERADAMGLNPPLAVKEILQDAQEKDVKGMSECVFFDEI